MRSIQRGITTTFIIIIILAAAVSITAVYFTYTLKQKTSVNSFETCAKHYPVMESYPEQCQTPDGKHFVRELSEEEKEKLKPPFETPGTASKAAEWKILENKYFIFRYPNDFILTQSVGGQINYYDFKNQQTEFRIETGPLEDVGLLDHFKSDETENINGKNWYVVPIREYCDAGTCGSTSPSYLLRGDSYYIGATLLGGEKDLDQLAEFISELQILK